MKSRKPPADGTEDSGPAGSSIAARTSGSMRRTLREITRDDQARVDKALSMLKLTDRAGYGIFLNIHYSALLALSACWGRRDQAEFFAMLGRVVVDLQALGYRIDHPEPALTISPGAAFEWGIAYVIRGSRTVVQAQRQQLPASHPASYLDYELELGWGNFLQQLDDAADAMPPQEREQILAGARFAFRIFADTAGLDESSALE